LTLLVVGTIISIVFVMRDAEKVKKNPSKSLIYDVKAENEKQFMSGSGDRWIGNYPVARRINRLRPRQPNEGRQIRESAGCICPYDLVP
jgi:hypothetical protein